ncbi:hypothetical protein [Clostridium ljungdahlii]|uniref:DUF4430 domain-containing protein n=1 Tax=Clostridium ljungdahlii TaxID=1538 RepID=A0A162KN61_9CLOT|nr:hypothetical protein [Clostridium ljungdahlii]OAA84562.1 hypothetical protein WY13_02907 [Clostridium ljungdahlii]
MIRRLKNKLFATLCITTLTLGAVAAPSAFNSVKADAAPTKTVYVDVEKNVMGQAPILQPVKVTVNDTETICNATKDAVGAANVDTDAKGSYIKAFRDTDTSFSYDNYQFKNSLPSIVTDTTTAYNQKIVSDPNWLREKEYNGISGWMFTVNNTDHDLNYNYYTASTPVSSLPDGAVIRWEFSMACGCDLGNTGWLPSGTVTNGYYNWNTNSTAAFFTRTDKTNLMKAMANHTNKTDSGYTDALGVLQDLQSSENDVKDALSGL